jgi:hypothetical protein
VRSVIRYAKAWVIAAIAGRFLFLFLMLVFAMVFLGSGGEISVTIKGGI